MLTLEKDYIDLIDDAGNSFIVYWAILKVAGIPVRYAGLIYTNPEGKTLESSRLFVLDRPNAANQLFFNPPKLSFNVRVEPQDESISCDLFTNKNGKVLHWNCHHPKAWVTLQYEGRTYSGSGYAETMYMPMAPWKIPLDELRWGRFHAPDNTIIWIEWRGAYAQSKLWLNGVLYTDAIIQDDQICFGAGAYSLHFEAPVQIRKGKLEKVIERHSWLRLFFKRSILHSQETKYKSVCRFAHNGKTAVRGWSLYETVILANQR